MSICSVYLAARVSTKQAEHGMTFRQIEYFAALKDVPLSLSRHFPQSNESLRRSSKSDEIEKSRPPVRPLRKHAPGGDVLAHALACVPTQLIY